MQAAVCAHHFALMEVKVDRLIGRAIDRHGRVIDGFALHEDE